MITFEEIKHNEAINTFITKADESLIALGYTEHCFAHVTKVADVAYMILQTLGYSERECELARIAGYLHDIGNLINRIDHAQSGAVMAFRILDKLGFSAEETATIISAIGNHDEATAFPVNPIAAALILADKTDVRRSRVRNQDISNFDIHDRVNYAVEEANVDILKEYSVIQMTLKIDIRQCAVMDYFEIFLNRMILCRKAAEKLGLKFRLIINGQQLL